MSESHSGRNYFLDFVKGIACICVVFMHCEFPGTMGTLVQCVTRFCVPYFFMVSGYFSYYKDGRAFPAKKKITHIAAITLIASAFYILVAIVKHFWGSGSLSVTGKDVVCFALFNKPFIIAGQLWFMFALLYVFVMYAIVDKLKLQKAAYYSIPILFIVYIALAQGCHLVGKNIPNMIYRNFLIEGFPLFMLGHLIHKNEEKLINRFSNRFLLIVITVSTLLCIAERYAFGRDFGVNICTFPQVSAIFLIAVKNRDWGSKSKLRTLGTNYSLYVYVIHPFVWHTLQFIYSKLKISSNKPALYLMPVMVLVITIVLSIIVVKVIDIIKKKRTDSE